MWDVLISSKVRRKVLGLFAMNPDEELFSAQVSKEINESPHAVGLELKKLKRGGLLKAAEKGHQTFYRLNLESPYVLLLKQTVEKMREEKNEEMLVIPSLERRKKIKENLERVVEDLKKYYDPQKIILFGSAANRAVGPTSDIDLAIIKKTRLPYFKRIRQLTELLHYDIGIDFFVYTPEEFKEGLKTKRFFKEEILEKGKVLYEKTPG